MIEYQQPLFRPPAEGNSQIFQAAYGCPHNSCLFCGMYKGVKYKIRDTDELNEEIKRVSKIIPHQKRFFLADGDIMALSFERLEKIFSEINRNFKNTARINLYANGSSIIKKNPEEIRRLRSLKLDTVYMGLESGSQKILDLVEKNESALKMVEAVKMIQSCSVKASVMFLLGIGGKSFSCEHIRESSEKLNAMQPRLLSALRIMEVPNSDMFKSYLPLSDREAVCELCGILQRLKLKRTVFTANHASNPIPLKGRLPRDKERLIKSLEIIL